MPAKHVWIKTNFLKMVPVAILDLALSRKLPDFFRGTRRLIVFFYKRFIEVNSIVKSSQPENGHGIEFLDPNKKSLVEIYTFPVHLI